MIVCTVTTKMKHQHVVIRSGCAKRDGGGGVKWECSCGKEDCFVMRAVCFFGMATRDWNIRFTSRGQRFNRMR